MYDYGEACPISKATSVLCERWTVQIIREMLLGAKRFSELQSRILCRLGKTFPDAVLGAVLEASR